ncbi:MAG: hypothetical protein IJO81_04940 [Clostridia bacterium]|nr:hypothetical protein [Clostridia bacterium]
MKTYILTENHTPDEMSLHGLLPGLVRMPDEVASRVSPNVRSLVRCTSGGRLRFVTDSAYLKIDVTLEEEAPNSAISVTVDGVFNGHAGPIGYEAKEWDGKFDLGRPGEKKTVTVFLPRTGHPTRVVFSLPDDATVEKAAPYKVEKPIVYYGSSITMGAICTSPAKCYTALVSERLGADHVNLGFGGSAMGEREMAEYIAGLDMSAFVLDYEHNAPTLDHLRATHKPFFDIIRKAKPTLPILIVSRPDTDADFMRCYEGRRIIIDTFHAALDSGDRYVDFIDGSFLWGNYDRHLCRCDDMCHPNDEGFARTADVVAPRLASLMKRCGVSEVEPDGRDSIFRINI